MTISAPIGGSGAVYQAGSGTTTLAANNTYGGGTVINNGTIQVGNGGSTGSLGAGPIANNGAVIFNRGDSAVVANALSGTGAVYQVGGVLQSSQGSVALAGNASSFTGPITVTNGNLYVNSSNGASSIAVGPGPATFILGGSGSANSATATVADANGSPSGIEAGYNGQGSLTLYGLNFQNTGNVYVNNIGQYSSTAGINVTGSNQLTAQGNSTSIVFNLGGAPNEHCRRDLPFDTLFRLAPGQRPFQLVFGQPEHLEHGGPPRPRFRSRCSTIRATSTCNTAPTTRSGPVRWMETDTSSGTTERHRPTGSRPCRAPHNVH